MGKNNKADIKVVFKPSGLSSLVPAGSQLTRAISKAGIFFPLDCGGKGTCGGCQVTAEGECSPPDPAEIRLLDETEINSGQRLACRVKVLGRMEVCIPNSTEKINSNWHIGGEDLCTLPVTSPVIKGKSCIVAGPSLEDPRSDLRRLTSSLENEHREKVIVADHFTAIQVSHACRNLNWQVTGYLRDNEMIGVGDPGLAPLGIAVDLGSTKLAAYLADFETGRVLASQGRLNPQITFGADVITRLQRGIHNPEDAEEQKVLIRKALNDLVGELTRQAGVDRSRICEMSLAGNSAMIHLLLGLPLVQLGTPPFVSCFDQAMSIKAREVQVDIAPGGYIYMPPLIGGYVGSDNTAMILGADLDTTGTYRLGLDIGTNTEVVLAIPGKPLFIASSPSGPTFEGAHLSSGMRALSGAISSFRLQGGEVAIETVDGSRPAGICGSGIIDIIAELLSAGIINPLGHLDRSHPLVREARNSIECILVPAEKSATGRDIVVTQADISQIQLAKGAINAACATLMSLAGIDHEAIQEIFLAGSFGSHINVENARDIGLVPCNPGTRWKQIGNAAGKGIQLMLNDTVSRKRAVNIPENSRYIELSNQTQFNQLFARNLAFPARN